MSTGFEEFRQLREVGVFSYLDIPCLKRHGNVLGCVTSEMAMGSRFHKVEPMLGERAAHGQPTARFGTVTNSPDCSWMEMVHEKLLDVMVENE